MERPILFSGEMVRAILEGRKTQTRRVIKPQPDKGCDEFERGMVNEAWQAGEIPVKCPYGRLGDRLWVREAWSHHGADSEAQVAYIRYAADLPDLPNAVKCPVWPQKCGDTRQRPSIHMPRWASRITLEVTDVRVERVQDISHEDATAEGCRPYCVAFDKLPAQEYRELWDKINAKRGFGWDKNPWVWVSEFRNERSGLFG